MKAETPLRSSLKAARQIPHTRVIQKKNQYETSGLSISTKLKRSLELSATTCLEQQPKLLRLQWSEKVVPQTKKDVTGGCRNIQ